MALVVTLSSAEINRLSAANNKEIKGPGSNYLKAAITAILRYNSKKNLMYRKIECGPFYFLFPVRFDFRAQLPRDVI